ncbi:protein of unknown function [Pararobbsia alpina]
MRSAQRIRNEFESGLGSRCKALPDFDRGSSSGLLVKGIVADVPDLIAMWRVGALIVANRLICRMRALVVHWIGA